MLKKLKENSNSNWEITFMKNSLLKLPLNSKFSYVSHMINDLFQASWINGWLHLILEHFKNSETIYSFEFLISVHMYTIHLYTHLTTMLEIFL